jgi:predicted molibdopterin-dependent oxidoreductase YjgC
MSDKIQLTIDGRSVEITTGATILDAAEAAGVYIPTLCADEDLRPFGACRLCLVEVEGDRRPVLPACSTPAANDMVVRTSSPLIDKLRRNIVELMLSDHPDDCLTCPQNNRCELQKVAAYVGVREIRFTGEKRHYTIDNSNPFFERDLERCILCGKCVRVCDEVQGRSAIHFAYRGLETKIATVLDLPLQQSVCESCGQCVAKCPTGALRSKISLQVGLPTGETKTVCSYCGVGCGLILQTRDNRIIGVEGDHDNPVNWGRLCVKGAFGYEYVHHPDRLTSPLIREAGELRGATWDEALNLVVDKLAGVAETDGPDAVAFLSSAKCTNEENYLLQKVSRAVIGTNNIDHCARL